MDNEKTTTYCVLYKHYRTPEDKRRGIDNGYVASFHHNGKLNRHLFEGHYHWSADEIKDALKKKYNITDDFPIEIAY